MMIKSVSWPIVSLIKCTNRWCLKVFCFFFLRTDPREMSCAWGNYHKCRLSERDCFPLMWPASLWGLLWQLVDGVTENKWGVFSRCWYGEEGANWVQRKGAFPKQWEDCALGQRASGCTVSFLPRAAQRRSSSASALPAPERLSPVWLSIWAVSVRGRWAWPAAGCRSSPPPHEPVRRALTVIREMVCVDAALCERRRTPHCNKFNLTAGTGWIATTTPDPPPTHPPSHKSWTVHQGSLYNSTLSFWLLWHAGFVRGRLSGGLFFHFSCFSCWCLGLSPAD